MADTTTANYNFVKPEVGASDNTWGGKNNNNWDAVDAWMATVDPAKIAAVKASLVDADFFIGGDSAAGNAAKKWTWATIQAAIWTAIGPLIAGGATKATPADADKLALSDSAAANATKYLTWANLKAAIWAALGPALDAFTVKATPVDADTILIADSAAGSAAKGLTWANLKATLWTALGVLIATGANKATPVDADKFALADSAASNASKYATWAQIKATLKTYFDTLYSNFGEGQTVQDVTAARAAQTIYQNTTGKPIFVMIDGSRSSSINVTASVSPDNFATSVKTANSTTQNAEQHFEFAFFVPAGWYYRIDTPTNIALWAEYR